MHTLKTGTPVEDGDPILKLLQRVSCPEIQFGVGIHSELDFFPNRTNKNVFFLARNHELGELR